MAFDWWVSGPESDVASKRSCLAQGQYVSDRLAKQFTWVSDIHNSHVEESFLAIPCYCPAERVVRMPACDLASLSAGFRVDLLAVQLELAPMATTSTSR